MPLRARDFESLASAIPPLRQEYVYIIYKRIVRIQIMARYFALFFSKVDVSWYGVFKNCNVMYIMEAAHCACHHGFLVWVMSFRLFSCQVT